MVSIHADWCKCGKVGTQKTPSIPTDAERLVIEIFKNFISRI